MLIIFLLILVYFLLFDKKEITLSFDKIHPASVIPYAVYTKR